MNERNVGDVNNIPNINFGFNEAWELQNWIDTCRKKMDYGVEGRNTWSLGDIPEAVKHIVEEGTDDKEVLSSVKDVFAEFISRPDIITTLEENIKIAKQNWEGIASKYFSALSVMLDIPNSEFEREYNAYYTFSKRCPFSLLRKAFMFNRFGDVVNNAAHELMHIEFLKMYSDHCKEKGINDEQLSHLKEILTVLLNEDMRSILKYSDTGYEKHKEIRAEVSGLYKEHKTLNQSFVMFLDKVINLVKKSDFV